MIALKALIFNFLPTFVDVDVAITIKNYIEDDENLTSRIYLTVLQSPLILLIN